MSKPKSGVYWKPIKTYTEYIEIFKSACKELGRSITPSELEKHKFNLPSVKWLVNNSKLKIITYDDFLGSLGFEPIKKHNKHSLIFGFKPRFEGLCTCGICYSNMKFGVYSNAWKGGTSPLNAYLRDFIIEWKKDSMSSCDYKCVITGEKFDDIHHLYSFNKILKEIIMELNFPIYTEIRKYTEDELKLLRLKNIEMHDKYPLGVCLSRKIHNLYHSLYGDDNTPEQFKIALLFYFIVVKIK